MWARWLQVWTPRELAESMAISPQLGERFCRALEFNGTARDTGARMGDEPIWEYVPLPPGPRHHPTHLPPELATPGVYSEAPRRGMPVGGTAYISPRSSRTRRSRVG